MRSRRSAMTYTTLCGAFGIGRAEALGVVGALDATVDHEEA